MYQLRLIVKLEINGGQIYIIIFNCMEIRFSISKIKKFNALFNHFHKTYSFYLLKHIIGIKRQKRLSNTNLKYR